MDAGRPPAAYRRSSASAPADHFPNGAEALTEPNTVAIRLELMTTATCLSLAEAIMQGDQSEDADDEDDASAEATGAEHAIAEPPPARRIPSVFSSDPADHFPNGAEALTEPNTVATVAVSEAL